jgi:16S rRNA (cytosine967-C5)-methyltransferase
VFLKQFFAERRQMGSRDRKTITRLCYQYYRLGWYGKLLPVYERMMQAAQLFAESNMDLLHGVWPGFEPDPGFADRVVPHLFPFEQELSHGIDFQRFSASFLQQPYLFLRSRPGHTAHVVNAFVQQGIEYRLLGDTCFRLENSEKIQDIIPVNKWAVVQDYSSQQTGQLLKQWLPATQKPFGVWDCCAASGGKSIMLYDLFDNTRLTVSDIRERILHNLRWRFGQAGIAHFDLFLADLTKPPASVPNAPFDMVVADVPCTGSGTWARTPEDLCFFDLSQLQKFAQRQLAIATNCIPFLKPGGYFVYITCSVFAAENEGVIQQLLQAHPLMVMHQQTIKGYDAGADSMFIALLQKTGS